MSARTKAKKREVILESLEEDMVAKEINKVLARARDRKVEMVMLTLPGEVKGGCVTGVMRHKDDAARRFDVQIPLEGLQGIILHYREMPNTIHRHRSLKRTCVAERTYTIEEIAAATGMSVPEAKRRAEEEGWPYLIVGE